MNELVSEWAIRQLNEFRNGNRRFGVGSEFTTDTTIEMLSEALLIISRALDGCPPDSALAAGVRNKMMSQGLMQLPAEIVWSTVAMIDSAVSGRIPEVSKLTHPLHPCEAILDAFATGMNEKRGRKPLIVAVLSGLLVFATPVCVSKSADSNIPTRSDSGPEQFNITFHEPEGRLPPARTQPKNCRVPIDLIMRDTSFKSGMVLQLKGLGTATSREILVEPRQSVSDAFASAGTFPEGYYVALAFGRNDEYIGPLIATISNAQSGIGDVLLEYKNGSWWSVFPLSACKLLESDPGPNETRPSAPPGVPRSKGLIDT